MTDPGVDSGQVNRTCLTKIDPLVLNLHSHIISQLIYSMYEIHPGRNDIVLIDKNFKKDVQIGILKPSTLRRGQGHRVLLFEDSRFMAASLGIFSY